MAMATSPRLVAGYRDAQRSAESLFESQSIAQIREVETKARNDIEDKKQQLRQLVGGSYRDLIDSADTILTMTMCCQAAVSQVDGIQNGFTRLSENVSKVSKATGHRVCSGSQHEHLFAVGSRVKYLVDTSELLWGCLDTQAYLDAAYRFLRASEVYRILMGTAASSMGRFPLLRNQWPSIKAFKSHILDGVQQRLKTQTSLEAHAAASALAASSFLDQLSSSQALALFLDCCRHRAIQPLVAAAKAGLPQSGLQDLLTKLAATAQEVVVQVGQLFLVPVAAVGPGVGVRAPLLLRQASDDSSSSELLFSPLPGQDRSQEGDAWQAVRRSTMERLQVLSQADASSACTSWVRQLAKDILKHCPAPMAACASPADFAALEAHLQAAISQWHPPRQPATQDSQQLAPTPRPAQLTPRPSPVTPLSPFDPPTVPEQSGVPDSWEGVCDWVLGKRLDLWQELFEAPFLKRAQALITASFQGVSADFTSPLQACLKAAQQAPPAPPGGYYTREWPEQGCRSTSSQLGSISRSAGGSSRSYNMRKRARLGRGEAEGDKGPMDWLGWRGRLQGVCHLVNDQLMAALDGSQQMLARPHQNNSPAAVNDYLHDGSPGDQVGSGHRAAQLEPFIQEQCSGAVQSMVEQVHSQLQHLGQPAMDLQGAQLVEQALLLGRLSRILGSDNSAMGLILGPPEAWGRAEDSSLTAQRPALRQNALEHKAGVKRHGAALHEDLQQKLRGLTLKAYEVWAGWVAKGLRMELQAALQSDAALKSSTPLQAWEETIITQEDSMEEGAGEMRFRLPAAPSPGPLLFLLAACREVARAGGHTTGAVAVQLLEWELSNAVLEAFSEELQSSGSLSGQVSEKGLLQLLFDVRFLSDALAGGRPLNDTPPAHPPPSRSQRGQGKAYSPAVQERQRAFQSLEASLSSQLDPIDWATYEPYLWANGATYYQRAATLFGALLQTQRLHTQVTPKPATSFDANILSVAPTAPRFSYLPISTPSLHHQPMRHMTTNSALPASSGAGIGLVPTSPAGLARPSHMLEQNGDYSFANINVGRAVSAVTAEQQRAVESASGTTLENLQSKFSAGTTASSQRLGAFGSLLGDKAAEVTAMAQQSLGDYVPTAFPSGLASSSLSGFTSQASGLLAGFKGLRGSNG